MEYLATIGTFFGGFGLMMMSFAMLWFVSVYQKAKGLDPKKK